jgi:hypothetical protein
LGEIGKKKTDQNNAFLPWGGMGYRGVISKVWSSCCKRCFYRSLEAEIKLAHIHLHKHQERA